MHELQSILDTWRDGDGQHRDAVLATVVHVQGSAYRRPGARMLIFPDGRRIGSISGGCLESEVCRRAWWLTEAGRPTVRVYDTTSEDDIVWEFGLGCNGVVHVLLERVDSEATRGALAFLDAHHATRQAAVLATIVRAGDTAAVRVGDRLRVDHEGAACGGEIDAAPLAAALCAHARTALDERGSRLVHLEHCDAFVEFIPPPLPLVVLGAGHDAIPLVAFAKQLGWHVTVADGRPAYAKPDRFPGVDAVALLTRADPLGALPIGADSVVVLMTHNFPQDAALLRAILPRRPRYLGVLGSQARTARLLADIGADTSAVDLHAPVGLDIGADTPESIALAIVAEIQATLSRRAGGELRLRRGPIHGPVEEVGGRAGGAAPEAESPVCGLAAAHG